MTVSRDGPKLQHDRQEAIYMLALHRGSVDVSDLAERYGVTTETIRRDSRTCSGAGSCAACTAARSPSSGSATSR